MLLVMVMVAMIALLRGRNSQHGCQRPTDARTAEWHFTTHKRHASAKVDEALIQ
jgi:hypothetical protein